MADTNGTRRDVLLGALATGAAVAVGTGAATAGTLHQVVIKNSRFTPAELAVRPGDVVRWTNQDRVRHNATAEDKSWKTPNLRKGQSAEVAVVAGMSGPYMCTIHPRMRARLVVG